jgi:processive 1,2-diacylglycerol beta-glucosyltransferase
LPSYSAFLNKKLTEMKVLLLTCNTGEGHNSAAKAMFGYLNAKGIECEIKDALSLASEDISKMVSNLYLKSTETPEVFKRIYKTGEMVSDTINVKSVVYLANKLYSGNLLEYIQEKGFDTVVCVHIFPAEAMTALKRNGKLSCKSLFVMTDYTCIPFLDEIEPDCFVIPHEHLVEEFVMKGVPRQNIYPLGIPVDMRFLTKMEKPEARLLVAREFNWTIENEDMTSNWFLIMSGSMGFGNVTSIVEKLLDKTDEHDKVAVVCGRNAELQGQMETEFAGQPNVFPIGFTDKIPELMDACDVLFTKPGGISSTEAVIKQIPIVHTAPIPGCETRNAEFFHYHNLSYSTEDIEQQIVVAVKLCKDTDFRKRMIEAQQREGKPDTLPNILKLMQGKCNL